MQELLLRSIYQKGNPQNLSSCFGENSIIPGLVFNEILTPCKIGYIVFIC